MEVKTPPKNSRLHSVIMELILKIHSTLQIVLINIFPATSYVSFHNIQSIFMKPVSIAELIDLSKTLCDGKSPGFDDLDPGVIKFTINLIASPLVYIFNQCLTNGVVPDKLKIARVTPVFKTGDTQLLTNYRPISVLSAISKLFEKAVYNRLIAFINKHEILSKRQFGFRAKHSTFMPIVKLTEDICNAFDKGNLLQDCFWDLSKAFDTLVHTIPLNKLNLYGIRGTPLSLFKSYLNDRKQYARFNDINSSFCNIKIGVPQGSILGPLLLIIYVNDMSNLEINDVEISLFADDTSVFVSSSDLETTV